jgi:hypothetical protein
MLLEVWNTAGQILGSYTDENQFSKVTVSPSKQISLYYLELYIFIPHFSQSTFKNTNRLVAAI